MTKTTNINIIANFTDDWNDKYTLVEIEGQIFKKDSDGTLETVFFDAHDGNGPTSKLNIETVEVMGFEVDEYADEICFPSDCFAQDMEWAFGKEVAEELEKFFQNALKIADKNIQDSIEIIND